MINDDGDDDDDDDDDEGEDDDDDEDKDEDDNDDDDDDDDEDDGEDDDNLDLRLPNSGLAKRHPSPASCARQILHALRKPWMARLPCQSCPECLWILISGGACWCFGSCAPLLLLLLFS